LVATCSSKRTDKPTFYSLCLAHLTSRSDGNTARRPARWRTALMEFETERLGGFEVDDQLIFGRLP
jgi:hypothetical protein